MRISASTLVPDEKRSFVAEPAGSIWYGDVMHGPTLSLSALRRKTYLVSLFDDVAHSAFCLSETALDIEGVLKQALLRRGVPESAAHHCGDGMARSSHRSSCGRRIKCASQSRHGPSCLPPANP